MEKKLVDTVWKNLPFEFQKAVCDKYRELTTDRSAINPYDDWEDVAILEEFFGQDNIQKGPTSLDLNKLSQQLDSALEKETKESLEQFFTEN